MWVGLQLTKMAKLLEPDLSTRLLRVTTAFNDVLYSCANEPSLGMYRIQEHVTVTVPRLVEQRQQLKETCQRVEDACYDLEYDTKTLADMGKITQFNGIKNSLLRAIELNKKLEEIELRKRMYNSPPPAASLLATNRRLPPPFVSPASPLSLPPTTLTKTTPTIQTQRDDDISDSGSTDITQDSQIPVPDMGLRPKTFD